MRDKQPTGLCLNGGKADSPGTLDADPAELEPAAAWDREPLIVLIDPKPLTRQAVVQMLARAFPRYRAVAVSSCDELGDDRPRLLIVYVRSSSVRDSWVQNELRLARTRLPEVPLAIISDRDDPDDVYIALDCGIRGYVPSSVPSNVGLAALKLIYAGGTFIPECAVRPGAMRPERANGGEPAGLLAGFELTPRELSVVDLLREGKPNKLIALELNMQESTVKVHVRNILRKFNAANRTQAASLANRLLARYPARDKEPPEQLTPAAVD